MFHVEQKDTGVFCTTKTRSRFRCFAMETNACLVLHYYEDVVGVSWRNVVLTGCFVGPVGLVSGCVVGQRGEPMVPENVLHGSGF